PRGTACVDSWTLAARAAAGGVAEVLDELHRLVGYYRGVDDCVLDDAAPFVGARDVFRGHDRADECSAQRTGGGPWRRLPGLQGGEPFEDRLQLRRHAYASHQLRLHRSS